MTTVLVGGVPGALDRLRREFPEVDVIDLRNYSGPSPSDGILFASHLSEEALAAASEGVAWVALPYTGIDSAQPELLKAPIVTCARGALAGPIAEYTLCAMLTKARNLPAFWLDGPPSGKWAWNIQEEVLNDGRTLQPESLEGQRLALFGFGGIGQRVAQLGLAFGMEVVAMRRTDKASEINGVELVRSLQELIRGADHLVICAPATAATAAVIDANLLKEAKQGLHLINVARGSLIDQDALKDWLDRDEAARASLDVCEPEPLLDPEHWLYSHPRVFLTPHSSWMGPAYMSGALDQFCENLHRYLRGDPLEGLIDREQGY